MNKAEQTVQRQSEEPPKQQESTPSESVVSKPSESASPPSPPKAKPRPKPKPAAQKAKGGKASAPPPIKGLNAVAVRNNFYRDGYRTLKLAVFVQTLAIVLLGGIIFYMVSTNEVKHVYFATTEDGRLVKMSPLAEPNLSVPALMSWSAQAVSQTMTFGFHDYRKRLQESSRFFTRPGWAKFTEALEGSGIMKKVEDNRQVVTAAPTSAPNLVQQGIVNGRYEWMVEIPMNITYRAGGKVRSDVQTVRLKIVRVPKLESPHGVGIEQWLQ